MKGDGLDVFEGFKSADTSDETDGEVVTQLAKRRRTCLIQGPGRYDREEADVILDLTEGEDRCVFTLPVAVLANHLRQAGWTVTPPELEET